MDHSSAVKKREINDGSSAASTSTVHEIMDKFLLRHWLMIVIIIDHCHPILKSQILP